MEPDKRTRKDGGSSWKSWVLEIGKWLIVIWLFLPLQRSSPDLSDFYKVTAGVLLFIIFTGKLFYDTLFRDMTGRREESAGKELAQMAMMIIILALAVGGALFLSGFLILEMYARVMSQHQ